MNPRIEVFLRFFEYDHLNEPLQEVARPFHDIAHLMAADVGLDLFELEVGLRKLLEAKDCMVRAAL